MSSGKVCDWCDKLPARWYVGEYLVCAPCRATADGRKLVTSAELRANTPRATRAQLEQLADFMQDNGIRFDVGYTFHGEEQDTLDRQPRIALHFTDERYRVEADHGNGEVTLWFKSWDDTY